MNNLETNPYHEMIRQEFLTLFHRKFAINFEKIYNNKHNATLKISKTMRSCKEYGYLIGLQGIIARILAYVTIKSKYSDPILPLSDINYDPEILHELEHDCGLFSEDSLNLYALAIIDLNEVSIKCSAMIDKQTFSGEVYYNLNNSKVELSCYPDHVLKNELMNIRNENKIKDKINFSLYKHGNDFIAKVYLNFNHYMKLSKMIKKTVADELNIKIFCLVARYEIYSGNTSGLQGAIPEYIFNKLYSLLEIETECFASPLNCYNKSNYFSAFYDTDKYFGSKGTFFGENYKSINVEENGKYEVNPPFINCIMELVISLIHEALEKYKHLVFFIIVPSWTDAKFYEKLISSRYLICFDILESKKHEYVDGMQHRVDRITWKANVKSTWFLLSKGIDIPENSKRQINESFNNMC
jgi:hypothetical protein